MTIRKLRPRIRAVLRDFGPATVNQLSDTLSVGVCTLRNYLHTMELRGEVVVSSEKGAHGRHVYALESRTTTPTPARP